MHTSRRQTLRTLLLAPLAAWFLPKRGQAQELQTRGPYPQWELEISQAVKLLAPGTHVTSIHWHQAEYSGGKEGKRVMLWLSVVRPNGHLQTLQFQRVDHGTYSSAFLEEIEP